MKVVSVTCDRCGKPCTEDRYKDRNEVAQFRIALEKRPDVPVPHSGELAVRVAIVGAYVDQCQHCIGEQLAKAFEFWAASLRRDVAGDAIDLQILGGPRRLEETGGSAA